MSKSVIWDMDGVLVDTEELHYQSWRDTLAEYGVNFTRQRFKSTFGMNTTATLNDVLPTPPTLALIAEISDRKEIMFRQWIAGHVTLLPGVTDWLAQLHRDGYTQAIASSAPEANIAPLIDETGIRRYFNALVAGATMPPKPNPDVFLEAARRLNTPPHRCVVIEDSIAGVAGAKRAGMHCIAVTTTNPANALTAADVVVASLASLSTATVNRLLNHNSA